MKFRKDINGLRAIAVIAVVLFHFNATWMPGGFAGVDVFFVISGFLMTGIIFRGMEQDSFSIIKFYIARANRIIPALALLCFVLLVFGWFYFTPAEYKALGKHAGSSVSFISNFVYWNETGYFDVASNRKWLLHTWTLSVEWQFYIVYPLVLVAMRKFLSIKAIKSTLLIATVISFVFCVFASYEWPNASYYLLPTRVWEMMVGAVAYLYPFALQESRKKYLEWTGLALVIGSYFLISAENVWPGYLALFPVLGAFLIIQAQRNDSIITNNRLFQKLGSWSYSIYLWHWPIVVIIFKLSLEDYYIYLGIALSILLGFLSYKYIEKAKFPSYSKFSQLFLVKPLYISLALSVAGAAIYQSEGARVDYRAEANSERSQFLDYWANQHLNLRTEYWLKCSTYDSFMNNGSYKTDPSCVDKKGEGGVFLWGDSHVEALSYGLRTLLAEQDIPVYQKTSAGCRASLKDTTRQSGIFKKSCDLSNDVALASIDKLNPTLVIVAQANGHETQDWQAISDKISTVSDAKLVVVGPVSQWQPSLPSVMVKPTHWRQNEKIIHDNGLDLKIMNTEKIMLNRNQEDSYKYISLIKNLCEQNENDQRYYCRVRTNKGALLQIDYGHLSKAGSVYIAKNILIEPILRLYRQ